MNKDEVKLTNNLYEGNVSLDKGKLNIILTIDNTKLLFQKKKGLFKKQLVTVKEILIKDIKINKGKIGIRYNLDDMTILTKSEVFKFTCSSEEEAKKIKDVIKKLIIVPEKKKKFKKFAKGAFKIAGAALASGAAVDVVKAIKDKDIKSVAKAVEKVVDKI